MLSECAYYLVNFLSAVSFIETLDASVLVIDPTDFERGVKDPKEFIAAAAKQSAAEEEQDWVHIIQDPNNVNTQLTAKFLNCKAEDLNVEETGVLLQQFRELYLYKQQHFALAKDQTFADVTQHRTLENHLEQQLQSSLSNNQVESSSVEAILTDQQQTSTINGNQSDRESQEEKQLELQHTALNEDLSKSVESNSSNDIEPLQSSKPEANETDQQQLSNVIENQIISTNPGSNDKTSTNDLTSLEKLKH